MRRLKLAEPIAQRYAKEHVKKNGRDDDGQDLFLSLA
jgi:hypothetical protein